MEEIKEKTDYLIDLLHKLSEKTSHIIFNHILNIIFILMILMD